MILVGFFFWHRKFFPIKIVSFSWMTPNHSMKKMKNACSSAFPSIINTSSTRTSRGRKFPVYKKKHKPTSKPIEKKIMHCRATKVLGSRMQHGNAQPTAAHALQGKRNAWVVGCDEDNAQPTAAYAPQRKQNAWTVGCDEDNAQPAAAYALQSNEGLGQSDATRQCAAHSGARTARETKCLGCRMRRRQRAAHSDCKATKFLGSRKQPCNAQPTAAHALQRYEILLIDPWLTHDARSCPL